MDSDVKIALDTFTAIASARGLSFAGMVLGLDPPVAYVIGNVSEKGHDMANLFRKYADLLDEKIAAGQVRTEQNSDSDLLIN
jgi:hypothetical protein